MSIWPAFISQRAAEIAPVRRVYDYLMVLLRPKFVKDRLATCHAPVFYQDENYQKSLAAAKTCENLDIDWRVHTALWAAGVALRLPTRGDFVECGVNRGFLAMAICSHPDWESRRDGRAFYLFDLWDSFAYKRKYNTTVDEVKQTFEKF